MCAVQSGVAPPPRSPWPCVASPSELPVAMPASPPSFRASHSVPGAPRQRPAPQRSVANWYRTMRHGYRVSTSSTLPRVTLPSVVNVASPGYPS